MGIELYGFAFFIFILVCIVLFLGKYLFSDIKRQKKMLDEKETKLLKLYRTVEDSIEEFLDQVEESKNEIKMLGTLHLPHEEINMELPLKPQKPADESRADAPRFQRIIDELADDEITIPPPSGDAAPSRNELVLKMWSEGKDKTQIAEELGITKTEVGLVLGLNGDAGAEPKK